MNDNKCSKEKKKHGNLKHTQYYIIFMYIFVSFIFMASNGWVQDQNPHL